MAKILVVEDYPDNLMLMTYVLSSAGHDVRGAETGGEALAKAFDDRPDVVMLDIQLPDMGGHEVLKAMRANDAMDSVPIVAVTAYAMVGDREDALAAGFDGYMPKPIAPRTLVQTIESYLGSRTPASSALSE